MECKGKGRPEKICNGNSGSISSLSAGDQGIQIHDVYSQSVCGTHSGAMQHPATRPWVAQPLGRGSVPVGKVRSLGAECI